MYEKVIAKIRKNYHNINATDTEKIKEMVCQLTDGLDLSQEKNYRFPVVEMLKRLGFELFRDKFDDQSLSGLIVIDSALHELNPIFTTDRVVIVNRDDSTAHQRFAIAHEIAHYIFDFDETREAVYSNCYNTRELENPVELRANRFAAELLMPTDIFKRKYRELKEQEGEYFSVPKTITRLSEIFDAPKTAVTRRIEETKCNQL